MDGNKLKALAAGSGFTEEFRKILRNVRNPYTNRYIYTSKNNSVG